MKIRALIPTLALVPLALGACAHERAAAPEETRTEAAEAAPAPAGQPAPDAQTAPGAMAPQGRMGRMMAQDCPMALPSTKLDVEDVEGGVAMNFSTTKPEQLAELRRRVWSEASTIAHHQAMRAGGMMGGQGGMMQGQGGTTEGTQGGMMQGQGGTAEGTQGGMMQGQGGMMGGAPQAPQAEPKTWDAPGMQVRAENTQDGARIVLRPDDPQRLDMMRQRLHAHGEHMEAGTCPMQQMMGDGSQEAPAPEPTSPSGE